MDKLIKNGDAKGLLALLESKANPNKFILYQTAQPLFMALIEDQYDCAKVLLDAGANPDKLRFGYTMSECVHMNSQDFRFVKLLLDQNSNLEKEVEMSVRRENLYFLRRLVELKACINEKLMRCAIRYSNIDCIEYLIHQKVNIDSRNPNSLLHCALLLWRPKNIIQLLLESKANPDNTSTVALCQSHYPGILPLVKKYD